MTSATLSEQAHSGMLDLRQQWIIGLVLVGAASLGLFIGPGFVAIPALLGAAAFAIVLGSELLSLLLFVTINASFVLKPESTGTDLYAVLVGVLVATITLSVVLRAMFFEQNGLAFDTTLLILVGYLGWGAVVGMVGVAAWDNPFDNWYREILIQLPLLVVPMLMMRSIRLDRWSERLIYLTVTGCWIVIAGYNILHFRSNLAQAYYLYETGRSTADVSVSILMLMGSLSLLVVVRRPVHRIVLLAMIGISGAAIIISQFRTIWIATGLSVVMLYLIHPRDLRSRARRAFLSLGAALAAMIGLVYAVAPIVRLLVDANILRLTSSSKLKVDPSLVNRYIEWSHLLGRVKGAPITGYGFGAEFFDYNWIVGWSYWTGYTHNGYLAILLKTGIIGLLLIVTSLAWVVVKGVRLSRQNDLSDVQRAIVRGATVFIAGMLVNNLTLNIFAQHDGMLWVGVSWGYILLCELHARRRAAANIPNVA